MSTYDAEFTRLARIIEDTLSDAGHSVTEKESRTVLGLMLAIPECPDCENGKAWRHGEHGSSGYTNSVKVRCPSCGGSRQSRVRVLIGQESGRLHTFSDGGAYLEGPPYLYHGEMAAVTLEPVFRALAPTPEAGAKVTTGPRDPGGIGHTAGSSPAAPVRDAALGEPSDES